MYHRQERWKNPLQWQQALQNRQSASAHFYREHSWAFSGKLKLKPEFSIPTFQGHHKQGLSLQLIIWCIIAWLTFCPPSVFLRLPEGTMGPCSKHHNCPHSHLSFIVCLAHVMNSVCFFLRACPPLFCSFTSSFSISILFCLPVTMNTTPTASLAGIEVLNNGPVRTASGRLEWKLGQHNQYVRQLSAGLVECVWRWQTWTEVKDGDRVIFGSAMEL